MPRKLLTQLVSGTALLSLCTIYSAQAEIIYWNGFDSMAAGSSSDAEIKSAWSSRYANGPDDGRVEIVTDAHLGHAARITYPAFANQSNPSGATWETNLHTSADELYMSYWVKVDADFDFVKGGKLPGLGGATKFPHGDESFSTRLMWREGGKLEFYLHGFDVMNTADYAGGPPSEPYRVFWNDFGSHAKLIPGQWHHIEIYQKLNTPGQRDGLLKGWLDGVLAVSDSDNSGVRAEGNDETKLNHLFFSTFFGGSSAPVIQWQPTADVYATFDSFTVSTTRINVGGYPGDGTIDVGGGSAGGSGGSGNSGSTGGSGGTVGNGPCIQVSTGVKTEIDLTVSGCLEFDSDLSGKKVAVWDSEVAGACDFRGDGVAIEGGTGALNVSDNYEATSLITGTKMHFVPTEGCLQLLIRAL